MAIEYEILKQASEIAEQAWSRWDEARAIPHCVEKAIQTVAAHPRVGQVEKGIYIGRQPAPNGDQAVFLTAVWDGAARLAQDPTVRCVTLERNPNIQGLEDATCLTIEGPSGEGLNKLICRAGEILQSDASKAGLVCTVLGNIARELAYSSSNPRG